MDDPEVHKKPRQASLEEKSCGDGHDLMSQLSDDLVAKILSFLSSPIDRCNSAAVSKKWLHMLANMQVVDCGNTSNSKCLSGRKVNDIKLARLALRAYHRGSLTTLFVEGMPSSSSISDYGLEIIAKASPRLKSLTLWDCASVGDMGFKSVGQWCKDLESLDVDNCPLLSDEGLMYIGNHCLNLSKLVVESCRSIGCKSLAVLAKKCLKLTSITLADCLLVRDSGIISLVSSLPELAGMKLAKMKISDSVLEAIAIHGKALRSLYLEKVSGPTVGGYSWVVAKGEQLSCLKLRDCQGFSGDSFKVPVADKFACLDQLEIKGCDFLTDDVLIKLSRSAQSMRILALKECRGFTSVGLMEALPYWRKTLKELSLNKCYIIEGLELKHPPIPQIYPSLDTLKLKRCGGVGDLFLSHISLTCDEVKSVSLQGTDSITDLGIISLFTHHKAPSSLSSLNLSRCTLISEVAIYAVVKSLGKGLRYLTLAGCRGVSDWTIEAIAVYCVELELLNVNSCAITDLGVWSLMNPSIMNPRHEKLQFLFMAECVELTDLSLQLLVQMVWANPILLDVSRCPRLSAAAVNFLQTVLLDCEVVSSHMT
ncbi:EIN3-binding F-box protein 2-like [Iris pallida]|uniref:EIN3-binding F-box protein 2-like n=1 Tax=Iris pallida TaxID=29817 RepID=A0AAX6GT43_IRIPA|nr:EIN3-binding F-box protein 2-like [Iris pallida]